MSDFKGTPGPWWWVGNDDENEQGRVCSNGGGLVAVITHECVMPRPEQDANARLIAAAPALLEALEAAAKWMDMCGAQGGASAAISKAEAAIAAAKG